MAGRYAVIMVGNDDSGKCVLRVAGRYVIIVVGGT